MQFPRHCEPTGRANARPRTGSAKQSIAPRMKDGLLRRLRSRNDELLTQYRLACRRCFGYRRRMKAGPDIAMVASLVGDPARANMLTALMTGRALTASELAQEAGITPQTASS